MKHILLGGTRAFARGLSAVTRLYAFMFGGSLHVPTYEETRAACVQMTLQSAAMGPT